MKSRHLVPLLAVADVERSITFYGQLGFELGNAFAPSDAAKPTWAWLRSADAQLMLAAATKPIIPAQQSVLFYIYTEDVASAHATLTAAGLNPGPIATPFYAPRGEFQLTDPDGYALLITHT